MNIISAVNLINKAVELGIMRGEGNDVFVYRRKGTTSPEGWYQENIFTCASELLQDKEGQALLISALEKKGVKTEGYIKDGDKILKN